VFHTDHDAIKYLVNKADLSGRIARWVMLLQEFQYQIKVKPGVGNKNVDYLSRLEEDQLVSTICTDFPDENLFTIYEEQASPVLDDGLALRDGPERVPCSPICEAGTQYDPEDFMKKKESKTIDQEYKEMVDYLNEAKIPPGTSQEKKRFILKAAPFTMIRGYLFRKGADDRYRRCVTSKQALQVMHNFHTHSGHYGIEATIRKIRNAGYWWPSYLKDIHAFIRSCPICQYQGKPTVRDN
jgi:hypothetical protein